MRGWGVCDCRATRGVAGLGTTDRVATRLGRGRQQRRVRGRAVGAEDATNVRDSIVMWSGNERDRPK